VGVAYDIAEGGGTLERQVTELRWRRDRLPYQHGRVADVPHGHSSGGTRTALHLTLLP